MLDNAVYTISMEENQATLTLRIDTSQPIEIDAFVGAFTSLAEEYRREIRSKHPEVNSEAKIFVKEVRQGSFEAVLIPLINASAPFIAHMDHVLILEQFVRTWGSRITALATGKMNDWNPTKSELSTFVNATQAIATDPDATSTLEAATFEDGKRDVRVAFKFATPEAISAQKTIDATYRELESPTDAQHKRVLMLFTRTDVGDVKVGIRSGERVVIEEILTRPLAIMYSSDLAEQRIKHEIREAEDNVYKKGFVVDVNVRYVGGKPSVYAIMSVHDVIDIPDEEEG